MLINYGLMKNFCIMNGQSLKGTAAGLLLLSVSVMGTSCINEDYDMTGDRMNNEVTLFQEGVTLPVGRTEKIRLEELLTEIDENVLKTDNDGAYYVSFDDSFEVRDEFAALKEFNNIPDITVSQMFSFRFSDTPSVRSRASLLNLETEIMEEIGLDVISAGEIPQELVSLGIVELENAYINMSLDASRLPLSSSASLSVDLNLAIPEMFRVAGADEKGNVRISGTFDEKGALNFSPLKVTAMDFTGVDIRKDVKAVAVASGTVKLAVTAQEYDRWVMKDLEVGLNAGMKGIRVMKLYGNVDYDMDPVVETVDLSMISDIFKNSGADARLDFCEAHLSFRVITNLGLQTDVKAELLPYFGGRIDDSKIITADISLNPAASASQQAVTEYVFNQEDVLGLFRNIPEKLEIRFAASVNPEKVSVLEPDASYSLSADYLFELPLKFGNEFALTFKYVVPDIPLIVGTMLSMGNKVKLAGELENAFPLGLDLSLRILDSEGNEVPLAEGCGVQKIAACGADGSAVKTALDIAVALEEGAAVEGATSLELVFKADSEGAAGVPLKKDSYLQAVLQIALPEGITLDWEDMMEDGENDNPEYYE